MSAEDQISAYGTWLDHYKFLAKMAKHKINVLRLPLARQAALLQGMQFSPNGEKWKEARSKGRSSKPVTSNSWLWLYCRFENSKSTSLVLCIVVH